MCDFNSYNWNSLLFMVDILIQKGELKEYQIEKIIDIVNLKKLVKYNKLSENFINTVLKHKIEKEYDSSDDESITMYDVERYQTHFK